MLDVERGYYSENLEDWKRQFPGKYVVVKGRELIGVFSSMEEALAAGGGQMWPRLLPPQTRRRI